MISKTKIEKRLKKKTNTELVGTLIRLKKTNPEIAKILARPIKKTFEINLDELNSLVKDGEKILVAGKILGHGNLDKKIELICFYISSSAKEKLEKAKISFKSIFEENKLEGFKIIK